MKITITIIQNGWLLELTIYNAGRLAGMRMSEEPIFFATFAEMMRWLAENEKYFKVAGISTENFKEADIFMNDFKRTK